MTKTYKIRKDISEPPTQKEIEYMQKYGQKIDNCCLDCKKPLYYFNQCDNCYSKMIASAKL